jgi:hypothetical protein
MLEQTRNSPLTKLEEVIRETELNIFTTMKEKRSLFTSRRRRLTERSSIILWKERK